MTVTKSNYERKANDLYETEAFATEALIRRFPVKGMRVLEPAAGNHKIVDVLEEHGAKVWASDIVTYNRNQDQILDFLTTDPNDIEPFDAIVTNPPYGKGNRDAQKFLENALKACDGLVAMLLTANFDFGKTRYHLFRDNPRFTAKIVLTDRISWTGDGETGTSDSAWYVFTNDRPTKHPVIYYEANPAKAKKPKQVVKKK